tara:strand:+ start:536 stop:658 length:123 start_codon:yes stop_codon:yes gene_type:complete
MDRIDPLQYRTENLENFAPLTVNVFFVVRVGARVVNGGGL